jgi:hypothetical protein
MAAERNEPNARVPTPRLSTRQVEKLVAKFDRTLQGLDGLALDRFGQQEPAAIRQQILDEYRRLIPEVPYIGGRRNMFSRTLKGTPQPLAIHRAVIRHGGTVLDTGEFLHRWARARLERIPRVLRHLMRSYRFSRWRIRQYERTARRSQQRRYPGDWVLEMVEDDGKGFDTGYDITECGIAKFLHDQGADELTPYICDLDLVLADVLGYGLERTRTLSWGCDRCDFRFNKTGVTSAPWPPEFIEQTCGESAIEDTGAMT